MSQSMFAAVQLAPRDPILGLTEAFNADPRTNKVNLGVGVYYDDTGKLPLLAAVREAEKARLDSAPARGYLPIEGMSGFMDIAGRCNYHADPAFGTLRKICNLLRRKRTVSLA